ncbi:MAG: hypothetical protein R2697_15620 [Ilumatobacteraceae bacterium]
MLQSVAVQLVDDHLRHCVSNAVQSNDPGEADRIITEATNAIERLVKSASTTLTFNVPMTLRPL